MPPCSTASSGLQCRSELLALLLGDLRCAALRYAAPRRAPRHEHLSDAVEARVPRSRARRSRPRKPPIAGRRGRRRGLALVAALRRSPQSPWMAVLQSPEHLQPKLAVLVGKCLLYHKYYYAVITRRPLPSPRPPLLLSHRHAPGFLLVQVPPFLPDHTEPGQVL